MSCLPPRRAGAVGTVGVRVHGTVVRAFGQSLLLVGGFRNAVELQIGVETNRGEDGECRVVHWVVAKDSFLSMLSSLTSCAVLAVYQF